MSKRQLSELEFPRLPGPRAGWVKTTDWRGRRDDLALYALDAAAPSPATAAQLEAASRRSKRVRRCVQCGAHSERNLDPHPDRREQRALCRACLHIAGLRHAQRDVAQQRQDRAGEVAELLAQDPAPAVLYLRRIRPEAEPGATRRPAAVALEVQAHTSRQHLSVVLRLAGPRNPHVPAGAQPLGEAGPRVVSALAGRTLVVWDRGCVQADLDLLAGHLTRAGVLDEPLGKIWQARGPVSAWRGELNPRTRGLLDAIDPGRADRLALLLGRIAAEADNAGHEA